MRTGITDGNEQRKRQRQYLSAETILKYLITNDDKIETLIICKPNDIELLTSDQSLYEALGCINPHDDFKLAKLTKLFEVVDVISYKDAFKKEREILKDARVEELRNKALKS